MSDQIVLAWTVDVSGTPLAPAEAAALLGGVKLYDNPTTDPVLGQLFGLTVADDSTSTGGSTATRTVTLNMTAVNPPEAPPPFPCEPITSTPPQLPYPLTKAVPLGGSFFVTSGSAVVPTTESQVQTLSAGDIIEFLSQRGVRYAVLTVTETDVTLTTPFTGRTANTGAFERVPAPVTLVAVYSTSDLDTNGVAETAPPIIAGAGAREVELSYMDSTGAGPFTVSVKLTGKRPAQITLDGASEDIATITELIVSDVGGFENSIGQLTLVELSSDVPPLTPAAPSLAEYRQLTDEAQLLISRALVYLPPSYFAIAQQGTSQPALEGDFLVTTGETRVETKVDQTGALVAGNVIQFASQLFDYTTLETRRVLYTVEEVAPKAITLSSPYTGLDNNFTGNYNEGTISNAGTKGNLGSKVSKKATAAFLIDPPPAAPPSDDELAATLGEFVQTEVAAPPPDPPLSPATVPTPTFLSNLFTQTLQLALAGVPITPEQITFI